MKRLKLNMAKIVLIGLCSLYLASNYSLASGDMGDFSKATTLPDEYVKRFHTEFKIDGSENPEKCAEQVLNFRKRFTNETQTLGVEPTVGLGAALLIFLLVGAFAAGIAQAFQMVNY